MKGIILYIFIIFFFMFGKQVRCVVVMHVLQRRDTFCISHNELLLYYYIYKHYVV